VSITSQADKSQNHGVVAVSHEAEPSPIIEDAIDREQKYIR